MIAPTRAELGSRFLGYRAEVGIHVAFLAMIAATIIVTRAAEPSRLLTPAFYLAISCIGAATAVAFTLGRSETRLLYLVPILDMVAMVVAIQMPERHVEALGFLAILPALWLGWSGRPLFAGLAVLLSLGLVDWSFIDGGIDLRNAVRSIINPFVVAVATACTYAASRRTASSIRSLTEQEHVTADTLSREKRVSELLDGILDAVEIGILAFDAEGRQVLANRAMLTHPVLEGTGLTPLELEAQGHLLEGDRTTPVPADRAYIARALRGEEYSNQIAWVSAPGTMQYAFALSARPLTDRQGEFAGTVIAIDDVTGYLETIAAKDQFVASVSHEFRTPLASIVGYLELILDDDHDLPDEVNDRLSVIERNAERLQQLVNDLLETASRERDAVQLERESVDVSAVCAEVLESCAPAAVTAGAELSLNAPGPIMAVVDPRRIGQAFENLVSNALKFSPFGGKIGVTVSSDGKAVSIAVRDPGLVVPGQELEALAEPFSWPVTSRDQSLPGVALRLAVTRSIIEEHRGTLSFDSAASSGTTVTITLPVR